VLGGAALNQARADSYFALSQQVMQSGLLRRRYGHYWVKLCLVPIVVAACFLGFIDLGKHTRHHANPNQEGFDPDIDVPAITFTPAQIAIPRPRVVRWLIAHQGVFFPILPFEGVSLHSSSVRRLFLREHLDRRWVEIGFLFVRIAGYLTMVILVLSPDKAAVFLAVRNRHPLRQPGGSRREGRVRVPDVGRTAGAKDD
jgi:hypothetical protein